MTLYDLFALNDEWSALTELYIKRIHPAELLLESGDAIDMVSKYGSFAVASFSKNIVTLK